MIEVIGRKLVVPKDEETIGYIGDHRVERVVFKLPKTYNGIDMSGFSFKLDTQFGDKKDIIDLDKTVGEYIQLTWTVEETHLLDSGYVQIQIRAFNGTLEKWGSSPTYLRVGASIGSTAEYPDPLPSEFVQMEARVTEAKNIVVEADVATKAAQALESQQKAKESEDSAADSKRDAGSAAEQSSYYAGQAGTYAGQAEESKNQAAAQAENAEGWANEARGYSQSAHAAIETIGNMMTPIMAAKQATLEAKDIAVGAAAEASGSIESLITCGESQPTRGLWMEVI